MTNIFIIFSFFHLDKDSQPVKGLNDRFCERNSSFPGIYRDISFHVRDNGRFEIEVELPITERERERIFITGRLDHGGGKRGFFHPLLLSSIDIFSFLGSIRWQRCTHKPRFAGFAATGVP